MKGLWRGAITVNDDLHDDDHPTTSLRKWVRRLGNNSAPTSSPVRDLSPPAVIRTPGRTNRDAGEDHGVEFTGGTFTASEDLFVHCTIRIFFSLSDGADSGVFSFDFYVISM